MRQPPYFRMRRSLLSPLETPVWPQGVTLQAFAESDAGTAHALLELAYADGGGSVPAFEVWWSRLVTDPEYDPALCFLARDEAEGIVAFAQCWTAPFVKDFAVHPRHHRRGIGAALLRQVFRAFQDRCAESISLKVEAGNASAVRFYEVLGMSRLAPDP